MVKLLVKIIGAALVVVVIAAGVVYFQDVRFWDRYFLLKSNKGILPQEGWSGSEFPVLGALPYVPLAPVSEAKQSISAESLQKVSDYAKERYSSSLLVWHKGKLQISEYYNNTDENTLIVGKSMAKMVVSLVVARAIKEGYIDSLDDSAAHYIHEWQGTKKADITVRNLLQMAAGLEKFYTLDFSPFGKFLRSYIGSYHEDVGINEYDLVDTPGTKYDYSQVSSDLIGVIIERATGKPYGQFLSESLIKPIGAQGGSVMMNRPNGVAHTGCCLLLPAQSWLRLGLLAMNAGDVNGQSLFPSGWMEDYLAPSPANPAFGLHIWLGKPYYESRNWSNPGPAEGRGVLHSAPYLADDLFLFDGNGHQVVYIVPSLELVIVRTGRWSYGGDKQWDNAFIPNTIISGIKPNENTF